MRRKPLTKAALILPAAAIALSTGCAAPPGLGTPPVFYPASVDAQQHQVSGDFDADGSIDLAVVDDDADVLTMFLNDGAGTLSATSAPWPAEVTSPGDLLAGDVTSDGVDDIIWGASLLVGDGAGGFGATIPLPRAVHDLADLNEDGHLDLVAPYDGGLDLYFGDGTGSVGPAVPVDIGGHPGPVVFSADTHDLNDDGHADLAVSGMDVVYICPRPDRCYWDYIGFSRVLLGDGLGGFGPPFDGGATDTVADFNEDGHIDYVVGSENRTVTVRFGDGTGTFPTSTTTAVPLATNCGFAAADMDADGHVDLVTSAGTVQGEILFGDGTGAFPTTQPIHTANVLGEPGECNGVIAEQIDGIGEPDVVFISGLHDRIAALLNTTPGRP